MNVLYLTINPNRASTTVPTEGWLRSLTSRGLRPVLASHEKGAFYEWACEQGFPAYHVPLSPPSKSNPLPFARSLWKLRNIVRKHRIDLIHCNEHDCYVIGSYLARWTNLPIVVSVHFTMARGFCKWAFRPNRTPDRMFFVSKRNQEACEESLTGIVGARRFRILHNGLDLDHYRADSHLRDEFRRRNGLDNMVAVGVGCALRPRKQLEHLFQATSRLPLSDLRVIVAGGPVPGDEEYAQQLMAYGRSLLGSRLIELGHIEDMRPFCNGLDLFINTSKEESFGIAVLEAMSCGCPVVGYDSKAVDEVVLPNGGEITPQDDVEALSDAISRWVCDPATLHAARHTARQQSLRFDIRNISNYLWDEYEQVLAEPPGSTQAGSTHAAVAVTVGAS